MKNGGKYGKNGLTLTHNDLTFRVPNYHVKFHKNSVRTASVGEVTDMQTDKQTDRQTQVHYNLSHACYAIVMGQIIIISNTFHVKS